MLKKLGKIGLAFILVIGLLPMISLRAYAAIPSFTKTVDFPIQTPVTNASGKNVSDVDVLPDGSTAVVLNTFAYQGNSYVYSYFLKIFDRTGALRSDVDLSSLMDTYYKMIDVNMLALSDGRILITYHKSDKFAIGNR
ncbi:hypothetical protein [Paenibacillus odorifer]|uniref:hypothetical protein n=1 Tax=Paenibacillus odorifer TaxID=189426 RepID=UPI00096FFD95|nr:hypothetical protein [Paenibacillus odorifer]OMD93526.1 hypothetical protein BSK67_16530 [Paenibacillus odorifer]